MVVINIEDPTEVSCLPATYVHEQMQHLLDENWRLEQEMDELLVLLQDVVAAADDGSEALEDVLTRVKEYTDGPPFSMIR